VSRGVEKGTRGGGGKGGRAGVVTSTLRGRSWVSCISAMSLQDPKMTRTTSDANSLEVGESRRLPTHRIEGALWSQCMGTLVGNKFFKGYFENKIGL
jgi:hypothetical protein